MSSIDIGIYDSSQKIFQSSSEIMTQFNYTIDIGTLNFDPILLEKNLIVKVFLRIFLRGL